MTFLSRPAVEVKRFSESAIIPTVAHYQDAGFDLYADDDVFIKEGETAVVPTGLGLSIPSGLYGKIEDRSSLASIGLRTGAGIVDSGYAGEIRVVLHNLNNKTDSTYRGQGYLVKKGQRVAQLVIQAVIPVRLVEVEKLETSERGTNGFGSTGR